MASNSPGISKARALASAASSSPARIASPKLGALRNLGKRNRRGESSLHLASQRGDIELVRRALESGVDVNSADNAGWTPLHEACICEKLDVAELLLASGADPNRLSNDGTAPLADAVQCANEQLVSLLLKHGAIRRDEMRSLSKSEAILSLLRSGETASDGRLIGAGVADHTYHDESDLMTRSSADQAVGSNVELMEHAMESEATEEEDEEGMALDSQTPRSPDGSQLDLRLAADCCPSNCPLEEEESNLDVEGAEGNKQEGEVAAKFKGTQNAAVEEGVKQPQENDQEDYLPVIEAEDIYDFHSGESAESDSPTGVAGGVRHKDHDQNDLIAARRLKRTTVPMKELPLTAAAANLAFTQGAEDGKKCDAVEAESSIGVRSVAEAQKVPPLRILIPRTPSEDPSDGQADANASPSSQSRHSGSTNSPVDFKGISTAKPKAPATESTQILTRSRVRQTGVVLDGNVKHYPRTMKRKREQQLAASATETGGEAGGAAKGKLIRCQAEQQTRAASEGRADGLMSTLLEVDQREDEEGSTRSANDEEDHTEEGAGETSAVDKVELNKAEPTTLPAMASGASYLSPPVLNTLERSSLRQSVELRGMIENRWTKALWENGQRLQLISAATSSEDPPAVGLRKSEAAAPRTTLAPDGAFSTYYSLMPEEVKVHANSMKRRRDEMLEQHAVERERLLQFAVREQTRLLGRFNHSGATAGLNICRVLRDVDVYNPLELDEHSNTPTVAGNGPLSSDGQPSNVVDQLNSAKSQLMQRLKYMVITLRNRHAMEAGSLHVCQQAEWEKTTGTLLRTKVHKGESEHTQHHNARLLETLTNGFQSIFPVISIEDIDLPAL